MTLKDLGSELADEAKALKFSSLIQVSGLSSEEVAEFKAGWPSVPEVRRNEVLDKLVEMCDDSLELEFSGVFKACLTDGDEGVREKAARGLWECDDRTVIRPLTALLQSDPSPKVRSAAATSLRKFATMAQEDKLSSRDADRIRDVLMTVIGLEEEELEVKRRAIEAAASLDLPEIDEIIHEAHQSGDPGLHQSAIFAMGQTSNPQWVPTILSEMDHEDPAIRYEAAVALGRLGDESTFPHLVKLILDDDLQVQLAVIAGLGSFGGPMAKRALQHCLKMEDEALVEVAQKTLRDLELDDPLAYMYNTP